jgi:hypothetical protein
MVAILGVLAPPSHFHELAYSCHREKKDKKRGWGGPVLEFMGAKIGTK